MTRSTSARRQCITVVLLALAAPLLALAAAPALPAAAADVRLAGFEDVVAVPGHDRVFVSTGAEGVAVADSEGRSLGAVQGLGDTHGMALTPDGDTLWVATDQPSLAEVDVATLTTTYHPLSGGCPREVLPTSGGVWWLSQCGTARFSWGDLMVLDPATGAEVLVPGASRIDAKLYGTASDPAQVVVTERDSVSVWRADRAEDGTPEPVELRSEGTRHSIVSAGLSPDGGILVISEYGEQPRAVSTATLEQVGETYEMGDRFRRAFQIDWADNGAVAIADRVFAPGERRRSERILGGYGYDWGGTRLHVVQGLRRGFVLTPTAPPVGNPVGIQADRVLRSGDQVDVEVRLDDVADAPRRVTVWAEPEGQPARVLGRPVVGPSGAVLTDRPDRRTTYRVEHDARDGSEPISAEVVVLVRASVKLELANVEARRGPVGYLRSGQTARMVARVEVARPGCVTYTLEVRRRGRWVDAGEKRCVRADARGRAELRLTSRPGLRYYLLRVRAKVRTDRLNIGAVGEQLVQFCPNAVPCGSPRGRAAGRVRP